MKKFFIMLLTSTLLVGCSTNSSADQSLLSSQEEAFNKSNVSWHQEGVYTVGAEDTEETMGLEAGEYIIVPHDYENMCNVSITKSDGDIIEQKVFSQVYVGVSDGDVINTTGYLLDADSVDAADTINTGIYKVGKDIDAGTYTFNVGEGRYGYYAIYDGPLGTGTRVESSDVDQSTIITIKDGQYLEVSHLELGD